MRIKQTWSSLRNSVVKDLGSLEENNAGQFYDDNKKRKEKSLNIRVREIPATTAPPLSPFYVRLCNNIQKDLCGSTKCHNDQ